MSGIDWGARAEGLLEEALSDHRSGEGDEAIITASAALAALKIEAGELPEAELAGWFGDDDEQRCACPADLRARGGHRGSCPVHGAKP